MLAASLYSIGGFVLGVWVGKLWCKTNGRLFPMFWKRSADTQPKSAATYDPNAPLPNVIPKVTYDSVSGEPIIAREEVHRPSPIPRSLTIVIIVLAALSVAYNAVQQIERNRELKNANDHLAAQVDANQRLVLQLQHQQGIINQNEKRLEDLVLAISTAKTPGEVTAAIQRFLKSSAAAHQREQRYQQQGGTGGGTGSTQSEGEPRGSPSPSPSHSSSASPSPSPRPTHSPSPSPSPSLSQICVPTPQGQVCVPVPSIAARGLIHRVPVPTPTAQVGTLWSFFKSLFAFTERAFQNET